MAEKGKAETKSFYFLLLLAGVAVAALLLASCQKKKAAPSIQTPPPMPSMSLPPAPQGVSVPSDVEKTWSGVVLVIVDKTTGKSTRATVELGSDYAIPGSDLRIQVKNFLPDFRMSGSTVTSVSNEPNNPAANVSVFEGKTRIFKGWLFSQYPAIHAFQNPKYGITLEKGIKKNG